MAKHAKILWIDLEMTGLDPIEDRILEVAAVVTDWKFNELAVYEGIVKVDTDLMSRRMEVSKPFWDANPEARDGLIEQNNERSKPEQLVENELLEFISQNFDDDKPVLLAGNSIHQDRKFIANQWVKIDERLHYRMLDVSAWKVVFEGKYKKRFTKPEEHRALGDIRGSIMELQYYLGKVKA